MQQVCDNCGQNIVDECKPCLVSEYRSTLNQILTFIGTSLRDLPEIEDENFDEKIVINFPG